MHRSRVSRSRSRFAFALVALGSLGAVVALTASCGDDDTDSKPKPKATPAERMCGLIKQAIEGCASATACDQAMVTDCADVAALLSDPMVAAAADCIEAGGAPLDCLASATGSLAPTAAHKAFSAKFCADCLLGVPGCEDAFYSSDGSGDSGIAGKLILPFGDKLVEGITAECAEGLNCATFPSCAQGVLAQQAVPEATISCIIDSFTGGGTGEGGAGGGTTSPGGSSECTVPDGTSTETGTTTGTGTSTDTGTGTGTGACGTIVAPGDCAACSEASCCSQMLACDAGTPCANVDDCYAGCTTTSCFDDCDVQFPGGRAARDTWQTCVAANCAAPQACDAGGICNQAATFDAGACDMCVEANCCAEMNTCFGTDFGACVDCVNSITGTSCTPDSDPFYQCLVGNCSAECMG